MIVEDEALLAMELESEIEAAGHEVVALGADSKDAMAVAVSQNPDFALVDIHLLDGPTGIDVGHFLAARGVSYVFVSGNLKRLPDDLAGALGAIEKPYTSNGLQNALRYVEAVLSGQAGLTVPPSLVIASRGKMRS